MNNWLIPSYRIPAWAGALGLVAWISAGRAAEVLDPAPVAGPNRVSLSGRFGFNVSARFQSPLTVAGSDPGPATGGAINRSYTDGFVAVDSSNNRDGLTWNWGYADASQLPGDDTVLMNSYAVTGGRPSSKATDDPQFGFELNYARVLGRPGRWQWGLETALGWTDLSIRDGSRSRRNAIRTTDAYPLGGVIPPEPPYAGSFAGPSVVIGDQPVSRTVTSIPGGAVTSGAWAVEASLYGFKLGPFVEIPIVRSLSGSLSGGLAAVMVDSEFRGRETIALGALTTTTEFSRSRSSTLLGGYLAARLNLALNEHVQLFGGAEYQNVGHFLQRAAGRTARVDLGETIFLNFGLTYGF